MKNVTGITGDKTGRTLDYDVPRNARRTKTLRNAIARKKLEALREEKELRERLADVWSEPGDKAPTVYPDRSDQIAQSSIAA